MIGLLCRTDSIGSKVAIFVFVTVFGCVGCERIDAQQSAESQPIDTSKTLTKIVFGSCAHQDRKQPIWEPIVAEKPDVFLFTGDNIYGDTEDMAVMREKYAKLAAKPGYQKLLATCPILAVWDDHDYGVNDGGAEYPKRAESEAVFHEFFKTPKDAPTRSWPGTYDSDLFGPEGKRVHIIRLDTRYFRSELKKLPSRAPEGPYDRQLDASATVLGDAQWKWLGEQLEVPADLRIIVSSIQVIPDQHRWELWENMPSERKRLFELIGEKQANNVVFVSGDRHMAEICELKTDADLSPGFPLFEITSSGLTNAGGGQKGEPNRHRVSETNFQSRNYGVMRIDWKKRVVDLEIRNVDGKLVFDIPVTL